MICTTAWIPLYASIAIEMILKYPSDHGGGTTVFWGCLLVVASLDVVCMIGKRRVVWLMVRLMAIYAVALVACDAFNILLDYEEWIEKGMPD